MAGDQQFRSPINLNLPQVPSDLPDPFVDAFQGIYNALRILQQAVGDFTGASYKDPTYLASVSPDFAKSIQIQNSCVIHATAFAAITQGEFFTFVDDAGVLKIKRADASSVTTRAWGWVAQSLAPGDQGLAYLLQGYNPNFSVLTFPTTYYLSAASPGGISSIPPVGAGKIVQEVGTSLSTTEMLVRFSTPIVLP